MAVLEAEEAAAVKEIPLAVVLVVLDVFSFTGKSLLL